MTVLDPGENGAHAPDAEAATAQEPIELTEAAL